MIFRIDNENIEMIDNFYILKSIINSQEINHRLAFCKEARKNFGKDARM